jgi:hypothetical protein
MAADKRKDQRFAFGRGIPAQMMAIDGAWRCDCVMDDVSEGGVRLTVARSVEGLNVKEFFLLLSSTGLAYRRCELVWVNGNQIGALFLKQARQPKRSSRAAHDAA